MTCRALGLLDQEHGIREPIAWPRSGLLDRLSHSRCTAPPLGVDVRSSAAIGVSVAAFVLCVAACCGPKTTVDVPNGGGDPWSGIKGWEAQFHPPSLDVPPGSLVALWKNKEPTVVCRNIAGQSAPLNPPNPAITLSGDRQSAASAHLGGTVLSAIKLAVGGAFYSDVNVRPGDLVPITAADQLGWVEKLRSDDECRQRVALACATYGATTFYLISGVLMQTYDYDVEVSSDAGASLDLDKIKDWSGTSASASVSTNGKSKVSVKAAAVYTNYQAMLLKTVTCPRAPATARSEGDARPGTPR